MKRFTKKLLSVFVKLITIVGKSIKRFFLWAVNRFVMWVRGKNWYYATSCVIAWLFGIYIGVSFFIFLDKVPAT